MYFSAEIGIILTCELGENVIKRWIPLAREQDLIEQEFSAQKMKFVFI